MEHTIRQTEEGGICGAALRFAKPMLLGLLGLTIAAMPALAQPLRVVGQASNATTHLAIETKFFGELAAKTGLTGAVSFNASDVVGVKPPDALRLIRTGAFDIISTQIGQAARDDSYFEGIDLVGVATDVPALRKSVEAYRAAFDKRLQDRFNAKVLTIWAFGPQVIYCNGAISGVADLKGKKVRVFTASMAALVNNLGGTAVTLPASEVYPALQRGVVECAITSATSGNTSKWPELTTHFFPLGLAGSVQGHFINLDSWKRFNPQQQQALLAEFKKLEDMLWDVAVTANKDAEQCNIGAANCAKHAAFKMTLVPVKQSDIDLVQKNAVEVVLPMYKADCTRIEPTCVAVWNDTVGKAQNLKIN